MKARRLSSAKVVDELELRLVVSVKPLPVGLRVMKEPEVAQHGVDGVGVVHLGHDTKPPLALGACQDVHEEDAALRSFSREAQSVRHRWRLGCRRRLRGNTSTRLPVCRVSAPVGDGVRVAVAVAALPRVGDCSSGGGITRARSFARGANTP